MTRQRRLQVVTPRAGSSKRKSKARPRQILEALLLMALGVGLLVLLLHLPDLIDLDSLLLVSTALANLIGGLSRLLMGILQLLGVALLVSSALLALVLLLGGLVRLVRATVMPMSASPKPKQSRKKGRR
ncbi:MAG: hypothetical protein ACKOHJ_00285 [Vulcanococcus sp.]